MLLQALRISDRIANNTILMPLLHTAWMVEHEALEHSIASGELWRASQRATLTVPMQLKGSETVTVTCAYGESAGQCCHSGWAATW